MSGKYRLSFIISTTVFFISFVLFAYTDLRSLTVWTLNIWDSMASSGGIRSFYEYSAQNLYHLDHGMVGSDILIYLPWAVWNLPIWILQHFFHLDAVDHFWMLLYSKLFLLVVFLLILFLAKRIAVLLHPGQEETRRMLFLSSTSFFTLTSLAYNGQNDVVVIAPFLAAVDALLRGKKQRFVLFVSLSVALKPFFLFSYVALILLYEKDLLKDILYLGGGCAVLLLQKLLLKGMPMYTESIQYGPTEGIFDLLLQARLDLPPAGVSLFILGFGVILLMAYFHDSAVLEKESVLYYATAPLIVFFLFTRYDVYRPFYLVPLLYLLMLTKPVYHRINLLLEITSTGALMLYYLLDDELFYHPGYLLISRPDRPSTPICLWLSDKIPGYGFPIFTAVFVLAMLLLLVINHPKLHAQNKVLQREEEAWLLPARSILYGIPLCISLLLSR